MSEEALLTIHDAFCRGFARRDREGVMQLLAPDIEIAVITSEQPLLRGYGEMNRFLEAYVTGTTTYSWKWARRDVYEAGRVAWLLAEGTETASRGDHREDHRYRMTMVCENRDGRWMIRLVHGSTPQGQAAGVEEQATSQENAEVVRKLYEGWARGDFAVQMDAYDPDVVLEIDYAVDQIAATGIEGMRDLWRDQLTLWDSWSTGPIEELIEKGNHVVVAHSLHARSRRGLEIASTDAGAAFTFRDGRIIRIVATDAKAKALRAVGLSE